MSEPKKTAKKATTEAEAVPVDPKELAVAKAEAEAQNDDIYTHTFKKPFTYEGKTYESLTFDFSNLTGEDAIAAQDELDRARKAAIVPAANIVYLSTIAARACTVPLAVNVLRAMPLRDFNRITGKARAFLLSAEL